ncbi:MAG TPA: MazG family protein [Mycobacteriales bacterium]|nr:MazG family protein [Mycobacteriales bacterium]
MSGRVVFVTTSPRVMPGVLSWPAWEALRSAPVLYSEPGNPQLPYLHAAGIETEHLDRPAVDACAADLMQRASAGGRVVWLVTADADEALVRAVTARIAGDSGAELEVINGAQDLPGARLLDVVAVMDRLRSPGGCPWDARQTHASLMPYLLEEAYEAYAALEDGDSAALREELGDLLLQIVFHARLAQEVAPGWSVDDVADDLVAKLVRRHPHVFAGASADDVEGSWEALKVAEKGRTSVTDGVPLAQPALSLAAKLQHRAAAIGAPLSPYDGRGGELWALVAECRAEGLDPEVELRTVARRYRDRLAAVEAELRAEGKDPKSLSEQEWGARWVRSAAPPTP